MINFVYAIKDELSEFAAPIMLGNDDIAKRYFKLQQDNTPLIKDNPTDFSIWKIGSYDTKTGIMTGFNVPELLERGVKHGNN